MGDSSLASDSATIHAIVQKAPMMAWSPNFLGKLSLLIKAVDKPGN